MGYKCDAEIPLRLEKPKWDYVKQQNIYTIPLNCGKCYNCKKRRIQQWGFRLNQEKKVSKTCYFVTLTYDTSTVPITPNGNMTLSKTHVQQFIKRLRYYHHEYSDTEKLKYYIAGEYGEENGRPHYHMIIFNSFIRDYKKSQFIYPESDINKAWPHGIVWIDEGNPNTILYTLKYIEKQESKKWHWDEHLIKERSWKSTKLGHSYIQPDTIKWHSETPDHNYLNVNGHKIPFPKYYRNKMLTQQQKDQFLGHIKLKVEEAESKYDKDQERNNINPYKAKLSGKMARQNKSKSKGTKPRNIT